MIEARKSAWFERLFAAYNRNLIARRFKGLRVAGLSDLRQRARDLPMILYANHSSWWDGLVAFQTGRACRLDQFVMMEERQLRAYPLFQRLGAFSVARERPREAAQSVEYAARLLRETSRVLWIFPQGETLPNDARPLRFYKGAAHIVRRCGRAYAAPVAMRYEFLEDFKPEAFARVGAPERIEVAEGFNPKRVTRRFEERLTAELESLRADILHGKFAEYEELVAPRRRKRD
ncbi:MAG: lysophospholipid acyltransferase family protein [Pyrinomonadaceae bacterium]